MCRNQAWEWGGVQESVPEVVALLSVLEASHVNKDCVGKVCLCLEIFLGGGSDAGGGG